MQFHIIIALFLVAILVTSLCTEVVKLRAGLVSSTEKPTTNIPNSINITEDDSSSIEEGIPSVQERRHPNIIDLDKLKKLSDEELGMNLYAEVEKSNGISEVERSNGISEVERSNGICLESGIIYTFYAIAVPFTCEMLMVILSFRCRDWEKFLRVKCILLSFTLACCSFLFTLFSLYRQYETVNIFITLPPFIYFTILYCFAWTSIATSDAFLRHMIAYKVIVIDENGARIQNVGLLAIELYGSQIGMIVVAFFFSFFNNFSFKCGNCNEGFETELHAYIPLCYFTNATLLILTSYILLFTITTSIRKSDVEKMLMGKMNLFANIMHCFTILWIICLIVIRLQLWIMWPTVHIFFFIFGGAVFFMASFEDWMKTSYKLLFMEKSKKCALVKIRYSNCGEESETIEVLPADKLGSLENA